MTGSDVDATAWDGAAVGVGDVAATFAGGATAAGATAVGATAVGATAVGATAGEEPLIF